MKDSYYFPHDSNARNDPKIKALINKYGLEGYGRFWVIIEMLRESSDYMLENESYVLEAIAGELKIDISGAQVFLDECVNIFKLLKKNESGRFYSSSLLKRMEKLDAIREKRKNAAEMKWKQRKQEPLEDRNDIEKTWNES